MTAVEPHSLRHSHPHSALAEDEDAAPCSGEVEITRPAIGSAAMAAPVIAAPQIVGPSGWKRRLEDPFNTYYRYPIALVMVRGLVKTPITPNQVSFAQPLLAALAGYLVSFADWRHMALAVLAFETRSILDCVDGSLARAKRMSSPYGHAIDAMADWIGVTLLYVGILMHFRLHPPTNWVGLPGLSGAPTVLAMTLVIVAASAQGAIRSFSFDYFKNRYLSIYEAGRDACIEGLRTKVLANRQKPSVFGHIDIFIGRFGHLVFEREWFDPDTSQAGLSRSEIDAMSREQDSRAARRMGFLWSVSGGDAFLSFIMITILIGQMWAGQVFFATAGTAWIIGVVAYNIRFVRTGRRMLTSRVLVAEA